MREDLRFRLDDLTGRATRALIEAHVAAMYAISPRESVHAFDVDQLRQPGVSYVEDPFSVLMTRAL